MTTFEEIEADIYKCGYCGAYCDIYTDDGHNEDCSNKGEKIDK